MLTRVTGASVPPQIITSARPSLIASIPSPIAMFDAAHAVHCASSGPRVAELDRDPACREVRDDLDDRERVDAIGAAVVQLVDARLERLQAADARSHCSADTIRDRCDHEPRVRLRLAGGREREVREPVHPPRGLVVDVVRHLEVADLAGEVHRYPVESNWVIGPAPERPAIKSVQVSSIVFPSDVTHRAR